MDGGDEPTLAWLLTALGPRLTNPDKRKTLFGYAMKRGNLPALKVRRPNTEFSTDKPWTHALRESL